MGTTVAEKEGKAAAAAAVVGKWRTETDAVDANSDGRKKTGGSGVEG